MKLLLRVTIDRTRIRSRDGRTGVAIDSGGDGKVLSDVDGLIRIGVFALVNVMKMSLSLVVVGERVLSKLL